LGAILRTVIVTALRRRTRATVLAGIMGVLAIACQSPRASSAPVSIAPPASSDIPSVAVVSSGDASSEAGVGATEPTSGVPAPAGPTTSLDAVPTRVVIATLGIDLPVIRPRPDETFPLCDVAEFLPSYGLPGLPGVTFVYAHARAGMFLPLLEASRTRDGRAMIGQQVLLYSSDRLRRRYLITEVHRGVHDLDVVNELAGDALVLQTSETSHSTGTKLVVVARPTGAVAMVAARAARPDARPRACG
jgi:hypothetical protein